MTLRSLLCLDYGSGICMRRAPRVLCDQLMKVQCGEHMVNKQIILHTSLSILLDNYTTVAWVKLRQLVAKHH